MFTIVSILSVYDHCLSHTILGYEDRQQLPFLVTGVCDRSALQGLLRKLGGGLEDIMPHRAAESNQRMKVETASAIHRRRCLHAWIYLHIPPCRRCGISRTTAALRGGC
jgi:hypothetical protein